MEATNGLRLLEETLGLPAHSLVGGETLRDLEGWDSLSTLMFIAVVDRRLGIPLPGGRVARCQTSDELCAVLAEAVAHRAA